jgi:hypothetical protein
MPTKLRSIYMISKIAGDNSKVATRNKIWWAKLGLSIVASNILFFMLFSSDQSQTVKKELAQGWVELDVRAELLTPFQAGKKVLLLQRKARMAIEAILESSPADPEGRFTVLIKESEAHAILRHGNWEIVPYLKTISFGPVKRGEDHEIRY